MRALGLVQLLQANRAESFRDGLRASCAAHDAQIVRLHAQVDELEATLARLHVELDNARGELAFLRRRGAAT